MANFGFSQLISDVKTDFFSQPIIDLPKPFFTDNRNVVII